MIKYPDCIRKDGNCYICDRAAHGFDCHGLSVSMPHTLEEKLQRYVEFFGEGIPVFAMRADEDLETVVDECLRTGEKYVPDIPDDPTIIY